MTRRRWIVGLAVIVILLAAVPLWPYLRIAAHPLILVIQGRKTIDDRLTQYGDAARARLRPHFDRAGIAYPPATLTLLGLKQERRLELYAPTADGNPRFIRAYDILAASGTLGPKLREGDHQVPEGVYAIESLNPNSKFHLALRVNYPNDFDRSMAQRDGRTNLGGDIMIHGSRFSVGCLAMGDEAAEDLFTLAADTGFKNIEVVLSPVDFRLQKAEFDVGSTPQWTAELYAAIQKKVRQLPSPE